MKRQVAHGRRTFKSDVWGRVLEMCVMFAFKDFGARARGARCKESKLSVSGAMQKNRCQAESWI